MYATGTGAVVTPETALNVGVVNGCIRILSDGLARTPLLALKRLPNGAVEKAEDHYLWARFMKSANPRLTGYRFKRLMHSWILRFGNAYAVMDISPNGTVTGLYPKHPSKVRLLSNGYMIEEQAFRFDQVLHLRGMETDEAGLGKSVVTMAAESIGAAMAEQQYGAALFRNGARMGGFIKVPNQMKVDEKKALIAYLERRHMGPQNVGRWEVLDANMEIEQTTMPAQDAQFLQSRQFTAQEIAGQWFGVYMSQLGSLGDSKYSDIEFLNRQFVDHTMDPHFCNWEAEINNSMLSASQARDLSVRFDRTKLTQPGYKDLVAALGTLVQNGGLTQNELREEIGRNPHPDGDNLMANGTLTPVRILAQKTVQDVQTKGGQPNA